MATDAINTNPTPAASTSGSTGYNIPISDALNNLGASTSTATSGSTVSSVFGDVNLASGKSSAGNLGTVKSLGLALLALGGFALYSFFSGKSSSGGRK